MMQDGDDVGSRLARVLDDSGRVWFCIRICCWMLDLSAAANVGAPEFKVDTFGL